MQEIHKRIADSGQEILRVKTFQELCIHYIYIYIIIIIVIIAIIIIVAYHSI
jgi:hypothetical protein